MVKDDARRVETHWRGDVYGAAKAGIAVHAGWNWGRVRISLSVGAGAWSLAGDGTVGNRKARGFVGKDAWHFEFAFAWAGKAVMAAQALAGQHQKSVAFALAKIRAADTAWVDASAGPANADDGDIACLGCGDQERLLGNAVNGINDGIKAHAKDAIGRGLREKCRVAVYMDMRVNIPTALGHGLDFGAADRMFKRMGLAVDVGQANVIEINQSNATNTGARQGLRTP